MTWHQVQDAQIDTALDAHAAVFAGASPVRRIWGLSDALIADKHLMNVLAVRNSGESFRVLDIGCGTGELVARLAALFPHAEFVGFDTNRQSIERAQARRHPRCRFECAPFSDASGSFDIVICSEVFEHVLETDALLDTLRDRVAAGGYLSISTPSGWMYRTPRAYNVYKFLQSPARFWRLYLNPERHWAEAVQIHPAILPSRLRRLLERRGFAMTLRQSALWWFQEPGLAERVATAWATRNPVRAATAFLHWIQLLEGAMNVCTPLRYFESRAILLMRKQQTGAPS
ncbi:MAG: methyltransferase domain-containing protein [Acidobacteriota bacterium]|nr:methyltransferase domain-containing protein [Acidobacteriota bacterium]